MQPVLNRGFTMVARRRRLFLAGVLASAVTLGAVAQTLHDDRWFLLSTAITGLTFGLLFLALVAAVRYRPRFLVQMPGEAGVATALNPSPVLMAAAFSFLVGGLAGESIGDIVRGEDTWTSDVVTIVGWPLLVALQWYVAWVLPGVRLRPDGVHDLQPLGSLFVPWDAFDTSVAATPRNTAQLTLTYRQPQLVRRRGFRPGANTLVTGSNADYLASVIHEYVSHPDHRPAIGGTAELRRLTAALNR
jgi:hypothetical protein